MFWIWSRLHRARPALLALDLGVFHRKAHVVGVKEALGWSAVWIALGLLVLRLRLLRLREPLAGPRHGPDGAIARAIRSTGQPHDGDAARRSSTSPATSSRSRLSVDNIFVIALIFAYFAVPAIYQHRVLFWGILGALVDARRDDLARGAS